MPEDCLSFSSFKAREMFEQRSFTSLAEMKEKLIDTLNQEFDEVYCETNITDKYLYLKCKVTGCRFQHGYTYIGDQNDEETILDIVSSNKVGVIHKHSIGHHATHEGITEEDLLKQKLFDFDDELSQVDPEEATVAVDAVAAKSTPWTASQEALEQASLPEPTVAQAKKKLAQQKRKSKKEKQQKMKTIEEWLLKAQEEQKGQPEETKIEQIIPAASAIEPTPIKPSKEAKRPVPKKLIADLSLESTKALTDLGLRDSFRISKDTDQSFFYNLTSACNSVSSIEEMKLKVVEAYNKEFGEDMLRINEKFKVVCKYKGCPFKLSYKQWLMDNGKTELYQLQPYPPTTV